MKYKSCPKYHGVTRMLSEKGYCVDCGVHWTDEEIEDYKKTKDKTELEVQKR